MAKKDSIGVKVTVVPDSTKGTLWKKLRGKVYQETPQIQQKQRADSLNKKLLKRDTVKIDVKVKPK